MSMIQKDDIEKKVNEALNSLDGMQRATPEPWFYTRVKARLYREEAATPWEKAGSFLARPLVALAGLALVLLLNAGLLIGKGETHAASALTEQSSLTDSESIIASNSSFDYENLMQP